ncbi:MAG: hypothetical protein ACFFKA_14565, partial [Candidatus Thorarchaeota archaeon]
MKLDNSNKRYPNFIAGILIISVASIFMACTFGIWDHKVISNENPLPYGIVIPAGSGNNLIENNYLVIPPGVGFLPAHEKIVKVFDTVDEGWLYFDQSGIPSSFPLTITQDILDLWSVTVYSYGGYEFVSGYVDLYQKGDYMGTINYVPDVITKDQPFAIDLDGDGVDDAYTVDIYELDFT